MNKSLQVRQGRRQLLGCALVFALALYGCAAQAQTFPSKPLSMVVPWPAGGGSDAVARVMSKEMGALLGQNIIVENLPGAGGSLGTTRALKAPADGHTLIVSSPIDLILAPLNFASAAYRADDARSIALLARTDLMIVTRKDLGVSSLPELLALMRARADKPLSYCTSGIGSLYHLVGERLNAVASVKSLHVPYTGFPQCVNDIVGGQIDFAFLPIGGPFPGFVDAGAIRAISVIGDAPNSRFPKIALASATPGFDGFSFSVWVGLHVSAKVPDAVAAVLNKAANAVLARPDVRKAIEASGSVVGEAMNLQQAQAAYLREVQVYENIAKSVALAKQ